MSAQQVNEKRLYTQLWTEGLFFFPNTSKSIIFVGAVSLEATVHHNSYLHRSFFKQILNCRIVIYFRTEGTIIDKGVVSV
jgi:hypothetical protein